MHNDSMVVKMEIARFLVRKVQIDLGSSADTLYWSAFKQQDIPESQIELFS